MVTHMAVINGQLETRGGASEGTIMKKSACLTVDNMAPVPSPAAKVSELPA